MDKQCKGEPAVTNINIEANIIFYSMSKLMFYRDVGITYTYNIAESEIPQFTQESRKKKFLH